MLELGEIFDNGSWGVFRLLFFILQVMVPYKYAEFIDGLTFLVKSNVIPMDRIDDAVGRILSVKFTMGLFENPLSDYSLVNELGSQVLLQLYQNIYLTSFFQFI